MNSTYTTKAAALAAARDLRAQGHTVKVHHHAGSYTRPGVGMTGYSSYVVTVVR